MKRTATSSKRIKNDRFTPPLEPIIATREELLERLSRYDNRGAGDLSPEKRADEATLRALEGMGFKIVYSCGLCAEPHEHRIPACPNVATVEMEITKGTSMFDGTHRVCFPHSRGRKVYAPRPRRRRAA